jgi:uncharacterized integral membrane protein
MSFERINADDDGDRGVRNFESHGDGARGPSIKLIALVAVGVVAVIWFLQNGSSAEVQFLWMDVTWPLRTIIIISLVLGALLGQGGVWLWRRSRRAGRRNDD